MIRFKNTNTKAISVFITAVSLVAILYIILTGDFLYLLAGYSVKQKNLIESYEHVVISVYKASGKDSLQRFMKEIQAQKKIYIYFSTPKGDIISAIPPTQKIKDIFKIPFENFNFSNVMYVDNYFIFESTEPNQPSYKVAIDPSKMEERLGPNSIPMYLRMILALTLLGLLSNKIASYYYSPLNLIKSAIKDLSEGVLTTRLTNKLDDCSDDLRELSKRFDKMAEHLETLFLTKGEMLQHVVHELRTPLARANMAITLLQAEIPPKGQADLNLIKMQISELSSLVDEILSLEKLNHAEFELNFSDFSLNEFIQTIVDNANYEINQKRARVESGRDLIIYADKELLARAVENIIRNSLLHSGDDTVISVYSVLKKNTLTISVNDNGKGIEDNKLKSIFEPFVQSEKKSANKQGYGLGLAIAKKVVVLHQGELKATNLKPHGLSITLSIPQ